jgi:MYXO-CTERM domain-containing protein
LAYLAEREVELELVGVELRLDRVMSTPAGSTIVRAEQRHRGVRVLGRSSVVHVASDGRIARVATNVARDLALDATPTIDAKEALSLASAHSSRALPQAERAELVVLPSARPRLVWQLDVRDSMAGTRYVVDAHTGEVVQAFSLATHALGRVYEKNAIETPNPIDAELMTLDTAADPVRLSGWSGLLAVTNYVSGGAQQGFTVEQALAPTSGSDFLYDPPTDASDATDGFAQVNLYYHLTEMRQYFESLGVDQSASSWKLTAVANALEDGQPLDNAFFSPMGQSGDFAAPNLIAIGQGSQVDFATDADVFNHEFGHYASGNAVGYNLGQFHSDDFGLSPHSGSIDEGIADYFACTVADDAELGEGSLGVLGAERDLKDRSKRCPDDMIGEVHFDGEIIGSATWAIRDALGAQAADSIVWTALSAMPPGGNFDDFAKALLAATQDLVDAGTLDAATVDTVRTILADQGLDDCGPVLAIEPGETKTVQIIGLDVLGQAFGANCGALQNFGVNMQSLFQFSTVAPVDQAELRFLVDETAFGGGDIALTLHGRKGQPIGFGVAQGGLPVVEDFDVKVDVVAETGELVIPGPFAADEPWFFAVTSSSCPTLRLTVQTTGPVEQPGTGGSGGGSGGSGGAGGSGGSGGGEPKEQVVGGCDCRASAGQPDVGGAMGALGALGLAGVLAARRRRRGR